QRRIWVIDSVHPGNVAYNVPDAYLLEGKLDRSAMEKSLQQIVIRHESLRTVFVMEGDEPVQKIIPATNIEAFNLVFIDLKNTHDPLTSVRDLADKEANTPFSLEKGPLIRVKLVRLADEQHAFLLTL